MYLAQSQLFSIFAHCVYIIPTSFFLCECIGGVGFFSSSLKQFLFSYFQANAFSHIFSPQFFGERCYVAALLCGGKNIHSDDGSQRVVCQYHHQGRRRRKKNRRRKPNRIGSIKNCCQPSFFSFILSPLCAIHKSWSLFTFSSSSFCVCVCVIMKFVWTTRDDWRLRFAIRWHLSWWRWWWGVVVQPPLLVDIQHTAHSPPPEISIPLR